MTARFHPALARLVPGQFEGLVWVTQDGDPRDAFVAKGGVFEFDREGLAVVEALKESRLAVLATRLNEEAHEPALA